MKLINVFAFGDSITYGARDAVNGGWASQLRIYLDQRSDPNEGPKYYTYNLGISGETTDGLLKRFPREAEARIDPGEENVILFAYGANDAAWLPKESRFNVALERFRSNLMEAVAQARKLSARILLLNITPVIDRLTANREYRSRLNEYVVKYNQVLGELAEKEGLILIDINSAFMKARVEGMLSEDGLHPNEKGHQLILKAVKSALEKII